MHRLAARSVNTTDRAVAAKAEWGSEFWAAPFATGRPPYRLVLTGVPKARFRSRQEPARADAGQSGGRQQPEERHNDATEQEP